MLRPGSFALTVLLALLTGLGPLSVDMYLASLPSIGRLLGAPASQVQLTISFYLIGFACAQLLYGPLSDRHGRRPVLLAALSLYLVASLACALAFSIETLIAARFMQAVGASGAIVLARAVVRDMFEGSRIGREMSRMAAIMALAPLVAPLLGGVLETLFGWRSNFVALFCFGAVGWLMIWFLLPETLRQRAPEPVSFGSTLRSYRRFLGNPSFVCHLGIVACCLCGLFAWISASAFVVQDIYGYSAMAFGLAFAVSACGYLAGTAVAARFVMRWGSGQVMGIGTAAMALERARDGAAARLRPAPRRRRDRGGDALRVRHGHEPAAIAGRRAAAVSGPRGSRVVAGGFQQPDIVCAGRRDRRPCARFDRVAAGDRVPDRGRALDAAVVVQPRYPRLRRAALSGTIR